MRISPLGGVLAVVEASNQTPREVLEASYQVLRRDLTQELLERIKQKPPIFARVKGILRIHGGEVEDHPDDEAQPT